MNQCLVIIDGLFQESVFFSKQAKVTLLWSCSTSRCKAWFGDREFRKQKTGPRRAVSSRLVLHLQSIRLSNSETVALYWECYDRIWVVGFLQLHPLLLLYGGCKRLIGFSRLASISSFYRWTLQDRLLSTGWISASAPRLYKRAGSASKHFFSWDSGAVSFWRQTRLAPKHTLGMLLSHFWKQVQLLSHAWTQRINFCCISIEFFLQILNIAESQSHFIGVPRLVKF